MNKKILLGIIFALVLSLGAFLLISNNSEEDTINQTVSQPVETIEPDLLEIAPNIEEIELVGVEGNSGFGAATRTKEGKYIHTVTAIVEDPAEGKFFEGWLVDDSNNFISTGGLEKESEGQWTLEYSSEQDLSEYISVVITEETSANGFDNVPEDHILEGVF